MSMDVRTSPWAKGERDGFLKLAEAMPAACETMFDSWQDRVDNQVEFHPHVQTYVMHALKYHTRADGVFAPIEPHVEKTFVVAAASYSDATDRVWAEVGKQWSVGGFAAAMILDGRKPEKK